MDTGYFTFPFMISIYNPMANNSLVVKNRATASHSTLCMPMVSACGVCISLLLIFAASAESGCKWCSRRADQWNRHQGGCLLSFDGCERMAGTRRFAVPRLMSMRTWHMVQMGIFLTISLIDMKSRWWLKAPRARVKSLG